jgi:hypothetical protein
MTVVWVKRYGGRVKRHGNGRERMTRRCGNFRETALLLRALMERLRPSTASPVTLDGGTLHQYLFFRFPGSPPRLAKAATANRAFLV